MGKRFAAYGWNVIHVDDANDVPALTDALQAFRDTDDRPTFIVVHSIIGWGSPKAGSEKAHGEPLGEDNVRKTKEAYGWPVDKDFYVPDGVKDAFGKAVADRGGAARAAWQETFARYRTEHGELAAELDLLLKDKLPEGWDADVPVFPADAKGLASRDSGGKVLNALSARVPWLLGGSADLSPSTKTDIKGKQSFEADNYGGQNFHFGVREHGMGAVVNGMALSHLRAYGSTFLVFLDYMRAPVRLSAIMELGSVWVLYARLDRGRRGRADAPADRASGDAARDPRPRHDPTGRCERGCLGLARGDGTCRSPDRADLLAPGAADPRSREVRECGRGDEGRLRPRRHRRRGSDPDRHRLRIGDGRRRAREAGGRGGEEPRRLAAELVSLRVARQGVS